MLKYFHSVIDFVMDIQPATEQVPWYDGARGVPRVQFFDKLVIMPVIVFSCMDMPVVVQRQVPCGQTLPSQQRRLVL